MATDDFTKVKSFKGKKVLFCYLDEAGDFNFSPTGTRYYIYTALATDNPLPLNDEMLRAKYLLLLNNLPFSKSHEKNDYFHATEDTPLTRKLSFDAIVKHLDSFRVYSIVIQKNKTNPSIRDQRLFFSMIMSNLLEDVVSCAQVARCYDHICILTDRIPVQKKSAAVIGSIKKNPKAPLGDATGYTLTPMDSKSDFGLQAADYCSWAIYRAWTNGDRLFADRIRPCIKREVDFFRSGTTEYY